MTPHAQTLRPAKEALTTAGFHRQMRGHGKYLPYYTDFCRVVLLARSAERKTGSKTWALFSSRVEIRYCALQ
jgi:hypothetical protein